MYCEIKNSTLLHRSCVAKQAQSIFAVGICAIFAHAWNASSVSIALQSHVQGVTAHHSEGPFEWWFGLGVGLVNGNRLTPCYGRPNLFKVI